MSERRLRVLLLEGNPADARTVRQFLWEAKIDSLEVVWLDRLAAGLRHLEDTGAEVVLLDLSLVDSAGFDTFAAVRDRQVAQPSGCGPETPIVVLAAAEEEALTLRAVREGAQDYLLKRQLSAQALGRAIQCAIERNKARAGRPAAAPGARKGRVLGFAGAKGGIGVTTVALNVAAALARSHGRVIATELAPGCAGFRLQLLRAPAPDQPSLFRLDAGQINSRELTSRLVDLPFGVQVLFGPRAGDDPGAIQPEQAEALFQAARQQADYVIVDLPPLSSPAARVVAPHCDCLALIVDREAICVAAGGMAAELLRSWTRGESELGAVVVNRTPLATILSQSEIRSQVKCEILGLVPHDMELCANPLHKGVPLVILHPDGVTAETLAALGKRLARHPETAGAVAL
jgi:Flp pilus assembly CpaE family ATPase